MNLLHSNIVFNETKDFVGSFVCSDVIVKKRGVHTHVLAFETKSHRMQKKSFKLLQIILIYSSSTFQKNLVRSNFVFIQFSMEGDSTEARSRR